MNKHEASRKQKPHRSAASSVCYCTDYLPNSLAAWFGCKMPRKVPLAIRFSTLVVVFFLLFLSSTADGALAVAHHHHHGETTTTTTTSRRDWLFVWMSVAGGSTAAAPCIAHADDDVATTVLGVVEQQCRNGALAVEQAVPGAYQQACMALPTRTIPVRRSRTSTATTTTTTTTTTTIELEVEQRATGAGSTGMVVWNSSLLLSRLLERMAATDPGILAGQTVLELGCGTGLGSLTAAALGARSVLATDGNPSVVELAESNLARNRSKLPRDASLVATLLPWGLLPAMDFADQADLVIGSDLTYFSGNWPVLAETMATVTKRKNGIVLYLSLGHSGFNVNAELQGFLSVASGYGLAPVAGQENLSERYLTNLLLRDCMTADERDMVLSSGGVRVLALSRKY